MKPEKPEKPLLLVIDPSLVFLQILKATLRRADCEIEIVAFQQAEIAVFWLSGAMDQEKVAKYAFTSPWDEYPVLRPLTLAIVNLAFPVDEREGVLDRLYCLSKGIKIITTSTEEELLDQENRWDEVYWKQVVSHLPKPVKAEDVVERIVAALSS